MSSESAPATEIPRNILKHLAHGIDQHGLHRSVVTLANELNVKSVHHIKQGPKNEWFFLTFECWQKEVGKDPSLLALLSAIVKVRGMGRVVGEVSKEYGPARSMYADCLKRHIGKHWQQLAYHLGVNRTAIDSIVLKHRNGLEMQVNDFLETVQFPDLGPSTLALILVALRAAGLDCVEEEVLREAVSRGYMNEDGRVVVDESTGSCVSVDDASVYADMRSQDPQNRVDMVHGEGGSSLFQSREPLSPSMADREEAALQSSEERGSRQDMSVPNQVNKQDSFETNSSALLFLDTQSLDRQSEVIKAMLDGDDEGVILALCQSDVSQRTAKADDGKLPIHLAAGNGYLKVLEFLLSQCSSHDHVNAQDSNGVTPLMMACSQGQEAAVELLLQNGADPNVLDQLGRMCLHFIETVRNPQILEALCGHKADVNSAKSETRITPLTVATVFGDLGSVQTLVEHGADPNYLKHQSLLPPLVAAGQEGNNAIVKFLLKTGAHQDAVNPEGYTALHFAALKQHADVMKSLLEGNSPCPDILAQDNVTPLMCAASSGCKEITEALLEKEAEVDAVRTVMTTMGKVQVGPLAEAALSGHFAVAEVLVAKGAYVQNRSGGIHSVLEFACVGGNPDIVKLILDNIRLQEGDYADEFQHPLQRAVEMGNYQCAQVIIDSIGLDKLREEGLMKPSSYSALLTALDDYEATLERNHSQLPNAGSEVSRSIGKSNDIFLCTRSQLGNVQRAVDTVKYALLFEPMSAVMVEKKLLIDVCKHILLYTGDLAELVTNALNAGWDDVVNFLADYGNDPDIDNPDVFLRRIQQGDPTTPIQFLTSQVTVDHLWDTAKAENKSDVEQFFAEIQRRTQNGVTSKTAKLNLRRHFFESAMRDTMARLKKSQHCNAPESYPTAFSPQFSQPDATASCLEDGLDSAIEMTVANEKPEQLSESFQRTIPTSVAVEMAPVFNSRPASTRSEDAFGSVSTQSTDSSMPAGRVPPPNSLVFRPQKVHQPLERCLDKLWIMKGGMNASTAIDANKCRGVLMELSKRIGSKWTFLARFLGLSETTILELKGPNGDEHKLVEECCHKMLREWICKSRSEATWGRLSTSLVRIMRADLVDVISGFFQGRVVALQCTEKSIRKEDISTLSFVANHVSSSWPDLAKQLNVRADVDHGAPASVCDEDQCLDILMAWLDMFAEPPCFRMLYKALEEIGFGHVITLLEQRMQ